MIPQACKQSNRNICIFRTHKLQRALLWGTVISFTWRYLSNSSKFSQLDTFRKAQHSSNIRSSSQHISSPTATWLTFLHTAIVPSSPNIWLWWAKWILTSPFRGFRPTESSEDCDTCVLEMCSGQPIKSCAYLVGAIKAQNVSCRRRMRRAMKNLAPLISSVLQKHVCEKDPKHNACFPEAQPCYSRILRLLLLQQKWCTVSFCTWAPVWGSRHGPRTVERPCESTHVAHKNLLVAWKDVAVRALAVSLPSKQLSMWRQLRLHTEMSGMQPRSKDRGAWPNTPGTPSVPSAACCSC